jgi:hypothetical protein
MEPKTYTTRKNLARLSGRDRRSLAVTSQTPDAYLELGVQRVGLFLVEKVGELKRGKN